MSLEHWEVPNRLAALCRYLREVYERQQSLDVPKLMDLMLAASDFEDADRGVFGDVGARRGEIVTELRKSGEFFARRLLASGEVPRDAGDALRRRLGFE